MTRKKLCVRSYAATFFFVARVAFNRYELRPLVFVLLLPLYFTVEYDTIGEIFIKFNGKFFGC